MARAVLPRVQAMVLCDAVQEASGEESVFDLRGVRTSVLANSFPFMLPRLCVYLHMSGHQGEALCRVEINRTENDDVLYRTAPRAIRFDGPLSVESVAFRLRNCVFPATGLYYVQFFHESRLIGERPLQVIGEV